ncbi:MAG: M16 family metallopeptidase [Dehalococcoidia bacterium]
MTSILRPLDGPAMPAWEIGTLKNGLRVVTTPVPTSQAANVNVFIGVGSRAESRRVNGVSHYLEHMLFKGTDRRPDAITIAEAIEGAGGVLNAYTAKELTCYWNQVPYDMLAVAMDVVSDMVLHSRLDEAEIERERTVVQQEIRRSYDQPGAWAGELLSRAVYGDQPVGWSIAGTIETVQGLTRQDMVDHIATWYTPQNSVLSVAGNVSHSQVMELAEQHLSHWQGVDPSPVVPALAGIPPEHVLTDVREITQCNVAIGLRAIPRGDPDRFPLTILNNVLGRGMSSRLFKEVRERRGLAYSVGSGVSRHVDTGTMSISMGVTPENLREAITVSLGELRRLVEESVPGEEMTKARDYSAGSFRLGLESAMSLGQRAGENLLLMGEIEPVDEVVDGLRSVTAEDVQRVAARLFHADNLALSVVGPQADADELRGLLAL